MDFEIDSLSSSKSHIFSISFENIASFISVKTNETQCFLVIDKNLTNFNTYKDFLKLAPTYFFEANEDKKSLKSVENVYKFLLENRADRGSFLIAIGGGITLDLAGFVASTFMRGIKFGFVPTSLLAMVDASIGGKNGVNFMNFKNYIGTFNHPEFIAICSDFLNTLPEKEIKTGLAEVLKYGFIYDSEILDIIDKKIEKNRQFDKSAMEGLIEKSVKAKVEIVGKDFKESGIRKLLNFGHTLGHALERLKLVNHGEGVASGMVFALFISWKKGYISRDNFEYYVAIIENLGLPLLIKGININEILEGIKGDKKKNGSLLDFILLKGIAKPVIEKLSFEDLRGYLEDLYKYFK